jgi:N-glycosylase/DNA lyase
MPTALETRLPARDYDLDATLSSGQVFGWECDAAGWRGVVQGRWVRLRRESDAIVARAAEPQSDWDWLANFLQSDVNLADVLNTFPRDDPHLRAAVVACHGLRLLRQDPWECLASFILSSTKQITQIRQIVRALCERFGKRAPAPADCPPAFAFPTARRVADLTEAELRECKMGFRAPYLLGVARRIVAGGFDAGALRGLPLAEARSRLMALPGVGEKIADCVLLFACDQPAAFPVDVWVARALRRHYFRGRAARPERLRRFAAGHFGPNAGYAQQYLFHQMRTKTGSTSTGFESLPPAECRVG